MQTVILAAGRGKRMMPLTEQVPKSLVPVYNRPILDHIIERIPSQASEEIIIVIGYRGEDIRSFCHKTYPDRNIRFVEEPLLLGTGYALSACKEMLAEKFLVLLGDDIHGVDALNRATQHTASIVVAESAMPERFGVVEVSDGKLIGIEEKPMQPKTNLVSTGAMVLDQGIFSYTTEKSTTGEYYLIDMLKQYIQDYPVHVEIQKEWIPIGYPEDLQTAESLLGNQQIG